MKNIIKKLMKLFGYKIIKINKVVSYYYNNDFIREFEAIEPFTMTSIERIYALKSAVKHIVKIISVDLLSSVAFGKADLADDGEYFTRK